MGISAQRALSLVGVAALVGCYGAEVDRSVYSFGDEGTIFFANFTAEPLWLKGFCNKWTLEQSIDGVWEERIGQIPAHPPGVLYDEVCVSSGRIEAGDTRRFRFTTRNVAPVPATMRVRLEVGTRCEETIELPGGGTLFSLDPPCETIDEVLTAPFVVTPRAAARLSDGERPPRSAPGSRPEYRP